MKTVILMLIVSIVGLLILGWFSCQNWIRSFPLYSELYIERPDNIQLEYLPRPEWWDYSTYITIRDRIKHYLEKNPNVAPSIKDDLLLFKVAKGMNQDQVVAVLGQPNKKKNDGNLWIYNVKKIEGMRGWYYNWGKLRFRDGILTDIEVEDIHIRD